VELHVDSGGCVGVVLKLCFEGRLSQFICFSWRMQRK
jgi:hypothetical protein